MVKDEILGFLARIDSCLARRMSKLIARKKFELRIIGKSALILAGLKDSLGTVDIDSLCLDNGALSGDDRKIMENLSGEFGRSKLSANGYYLEFVAEAIVFLPRNPRWLPLHGRWDALEVSIVDPAYGVASKLFSAFSQPPRRQDLGDIVASLDQKLVAFDQVVAIADQIFDLYSMDARSSRFPRVHAHIRKLMEHYGEVPLDFEPDEEH